MEDLYDLVRRLEEKISELPAGYISKKNIRGKTQYYRQWKENSRIKSKYIREDQVAQVREQIEERKKLQERLKEMKKKLPEEDGRATPFETNVIRGEALARLVSNVRGFKKRDVYRLLEMYVHGSEWSRVCVLYGLRRTGKTTLLFQAAADLEEEDFARAVYIKLQPQNTMDTLNRDLDRLYRQHYKYVFLDEVTLMKDFIDSAALLSDIYVPMGMRIILSGTDSLGFWFARDNELYDRERTIHTTFIPYREYSRVLGIDSIDEYIRYGGTLRAGETAFEDVDANAADAAFRDDESTRRYIDTSIAKNIQHSLEYYESGSNFYHLYPLYEKGELTGAINRVVEDMNHRFVLKVLTRDFTSGDLGISARNLRKERDPEKRTTVLDEIDKETVPRKLMEILEIRNKEEQTVGLTEGLAQLIKKYLESLDLIVDCPIESAQPGLPAQEHILFTQPGMRYCQAQALVYSLMQDEVFALLSDESKAYVSGRILEEVRGRMLEDIILLESVKALPKKYKVFKLVFEKGEFDMVIRDRETNACAVYEIKHSDQCVREQARHLMDEEKLGLAELRFGKLVGRYVLYLGKNLDTEENIAYRNAQDFLKSLPKVVLESGLENGSFSS